MSEPTYYKYGYVAGTIWAQQNKDASPDDLGRERDTRLARMKRDGFPTAAQESWGTGFWEGASTILQ